MLQRPIARRSLLQQLLGTYLLFVLVVLVAGVAAAVVMRSQLQLQVQTSDLALAQAIALELDNKLQNARAALVELSELSELHTNDLPAMERAFRAFKAARQDVDRVYWLDASGLLRASVPTDARSIGTDYADEQVFRLSLAADGPFVVAGVVDLTTFNPVAILAQPVRDEQGNLLGVVATNLLLDNLSAPLRTIVAGQEKTLQIKVIDEEGQLIASPERERLLQPMLAELPGANEALAGRSATRLANGRDGQPWLYSAEPVRSVGWAVVVQHFAADAFAVVGDFTRWLIAVALLFAGGGVIFWLVLNWRVIGPLQAMARQQGELTHGSLLTAPVPERLARRSDEVGELARSLQELHGSVNRRLTELQTLLETSNAVVSTLDPTVVGRRIVDAVRQLVDVQAVTVLVPDEQGVLRVLVSEGHKADYDRTLSIAADNPTSPSAMALRECRPVQLIAGVSDFFPPIAHAEGFRALLALPIISRHVGGVVLVVYRACANPFSVNEIGLLLAFANHATLAWEHAVLYERSDERLREIASENQRLYHEAQQERQQLAAIMGSMEDGLVLARDDGTVLYANRGASTLLELAYPAPVGQPIETVYAALQRLGDPPTPLSLPESRSHSQLVALRRAGQPAWVQLRAFAVVGPTNELIGHGLLLRDVTHEREIDQFKTTLLGAVGHELRTPLAAIKGHASTLLQEDVHWSPAEQRHFLRTINDEADRLTLLVRNLLDLARLEAGLLALHCMPWPLPLLVQRSLKRLPTLVDRTIVVDLPPELPPVLVDSQRIEVVIDNLLNNALLYGGDTIHIKATAHAEQIVLAVIDNGEGLPAGELPHLFERFYRARQNSQRHVGGSGLGLAICKAFVEAHGGRIWVESGPHTTSFICTLPLAQNHDEPDHLATKSDVVNEETAVSRQ